MTNRRLASLTPEGKNLREIRYLFNLNQKEFAKLLGIGQTYMSNYERGLYIIPLNVAQLIIGMLRKKKITKYVVGDLVRVQEEV